jgi:sugar lactone lactonase YvrE
LFLKAKVTCPKARQPFTAARTRQIQRTPFSRQMNSVMLSGLQLDLHFRRCNMTKLSGTNYSILTLLTLCLAFGPPNYLEGAMLTTGFFSGTILKFDGLSGPGTTFATVASAGDPFPGLAGIAINPTNSQVFVSARVSDRIYSYDGVTGALLGFQQLPIGTSPAGLAFSSNGTLYVSNFGSNSIASYNVANNSMFSALNTITIPNSLPNGLAFDASGRLLISTFGGQGILASNTNLSSTTTFAANPTANGQIAVDTQGNVYVGSAAVSNDVFKFDSTGNSIGSPWASILLPQPAQPFASPDLSSPTGVAIDHDGNIIIAALGQTNPTSASDNFQSNGGLFRYSPNGGLLAPAIATGTTPFSSIVVIAIPEPSSAVFVLSFMLVASGLQWVRPSSFMGLRNA